MKKNKIIVICIASALVLAAVISSHKRSEPISSNVQNISSEKTTSLEAQKNNPLKADNEKIAAKISENTSTKSAPENKGPSLSFSDLKKNYLGYSDDELQNELKNIDSEIDNGHYIEMANANTLTKEQRESLGLLLKKRDAINIVKINKQLNKVKS